MDEKMYNEAIRGGLNPFFYYGVYEHMVLYIYNKV